MIAAYYRKGGDFTLENSEKFAAGQEELQPCAAFSRGPWSLDEEPVLCENCALPEQGKCPRGAEAGSVPGRNV